MKKHSALIGSLFKLSQSVNVHWGFYNVVPFSCAWTVFPALASLGRPSAQFVCSHWVSLSRNKGGRSVLLCPFVSHMSEVRCTNNAATAKKKQSLSLVESLSLSSCNHNSNYKKKLLCKQVDYAMLITRAQCSRRVFKCHSPLCRAQKQRAVHPPPYAKQWRVPRQLV